MKTTQLMQTAKALLVPGKGLLAMDESEHTCNMRLAEAGIAQTAAMRRHYRHLLLTTPGLAEGISGAILHDETIRQPLLDAKGSKERSAVEFLTRAGIVAGIKVDLGTRPMAMFPGEVATQGLDGLDERVSEYAAMGARFAKWRAVITIGPSQPTDGCIEANAHQLARYASICQEAGLLPIIEPEVVMEGDHDLDRCEEVTLQVLLAVFLQLRAQRVLVEATILKPNMVLPGSEASKIASDEQIARATLRCLRRAVPAAVAGIAFLSGGQSDIVATQRLNAICSFASAPWPLTFSFARALQHPALRAWAGKPANVRTAQSVLIHRVRCNSEAQRGHYSPCMDSGCTIMTPTAGTRRTLVRP
ncbi:MAG: fructose-bisphosphate aldolase class I [Planctomycetota bacterium]|nr:fructose-bisphosphate aldolase class I [Planctomycetota bacterium]